MDATLPLPVPQDTSAGADDDYYMLLKGETLQGKKFRPSDWAERLYGVAAFYAEENNAHSSKISESICTTFHEGSKGLLVDPKMADVAPDLINFVRKFAKDNKLRVVMLDPGEWSSDRRRVVKKPQRKFV